MRVFLPISLDRWRNPIATLLRACVEHNPGVEFYSFSRPFSAEDVRCGESFWSLPNIRRGALPSLVTRRYDIVHTASISGKNLALTALAKVRGFGRAKFLNTINLEVDHGAGKDWRLLLAAESLADAMVAVSEAAGRGTRRRHPDLFRGVIPNGFCANYFDPAIDDPEALPAEIADLPRRGFALYIGALEPRKRPEVLVQLAQANPELTIVGAGYVHPLGRGFVPMIRSVPNLRWLGHVDRRTVRALLRHAAVFLFPSEREGLALSVIEALGMGLPVIGQPKSSMGELVRSGENGELIDVRDLSAWGAALRRYCGLGGAEREVLAAAIRSDAVARYDWAGIGRRYGELYHALHQGN